MTTACAGVPQTPSEFKTYALGSSFTSITEATVPNTKLSVVEKRMVAFGNGCFTKSVELRAHGTFGGSQSVSRNDYRPVFAREKDNSSLYVQNKSSAGCGPLATCPKDGVYVAFVEARQAGADVAVKFGSVSLGPLKLPNFSRDALGWITGKEEFCPELGTY